jgi:UDP-N-acetylmuramoyl-L-alanyl-D-glutamate--2,6-diaminopimelate ligase
VTLDQLVEEMEVVAVAGDRSREIAGLAYDSRRVRAGDVFFALSGVKQDGARFVRDAVAAGAAAVIAAPGVEVEGAARVTVAEPRLALAQAARRLYRHPSHAMKLVAVTGTNGKTTTTWMLESIFRAAGWSAGVIGTTGVRFMGESRSSVFTTPESPELQALLAEMRDAGVQAVAMEVSSHALAQRRAWGIAADICVFTNLTQDHLDYHGTMEAYLDAKLMLFDGRNGGSGKPVTAVVNADDPHAGEVAGAARRGGSRILACGTGTGDTAVPLDVRVRGIDPMGAGMDLHLEIDVPHDLRVGKGWDPWDDSAGGDRHVRLPMLGSYNALNAAAAYASAIALRLPLPVIEQGLESLPGVPGRLERVDAGQPFTVVVDYAHTPDALERALGAVREHARARVHVVFGCGGDRDRGKRPLMGGVAARLADVVWVTSDNPRSEDPGSIVAEIAAGASGARELHLEVDRRAAIASALAAAGEGDVVLVAGKGHETTQTIGDRVLPFDDRQVARDLLRGGRGA